MNGSPAAPNRLYASQFTGWFERRFNARMMAARHGSRLATNSHTMACPAHTCGTTARNIPGNSSALELQRSLTDPDRATPEWKTPRCSAPPMGDRPGMNFPDCARRREISGNRALAECACTRSFSIQAILNECLSPFLLRVHSAPMMAARHGTHQPGLNSGSELPDASAEVGHCVHNIAMHPSRPNVLFMQKHWDVMRSDDAGASWNEVSGNLPSDFGFQLPYTHTSQTPFMLCRSKATRSIIRRKENCACIEVAQAVTSGKRSRRDCRKAIAMSTSCAVRWRLTH